MGSLLFQHLLAARADFPPVPNTIFQDTAAPTFTISTVGASGAITYSVTDYAGATVLQGQSVATGGRVYLVLPQLADDYYVLQVADKTTGTVAIQSISFAVVSAFTRSADSPFGVGVHFVKGGNSGVVPLITTMGAGMIRDDATWSTIERSPGIYNFAPFDSSLQVLQQNAVDPVLVLDYNNSFYDKGLTPYDATGLTAFANYAQAVVTHYGQQVKAVEVYNEYNGVFSKGPCARQPACYARLLAYTYRAIKAVRPDVTVIGGAALYADLNWFNGVFANNGLAYMDAVSDHPYTTLDIVSPELQGLGEEMTNLQSLIMRYNQGRPKPIWITEIGWPTSFLHVSERSQADYLVRSAVLSQAAGVQKFFWYDLVNDGYDSSKTEQNFGLLRRPDAAGRYTPKPAYVAYATLIRELSGHAFVHREAVLPGIFDMLFTDNLRVLWSTPFKQGVTLTTNSPINVISIMGRAQTLIPVGGRIILNLSADPVYVQGAITSVSWHNPL